MLGIEPYMIQQDYASKDSFFDKLNNYLLAARREKWLDEKTIVVFPEYTGTWLVLAGESEETFRAASLNWAERGMVFRHPLKFLSYFLKAKEKGKAEAAFFRMKASQMADIYQDVFSQLARDHKVTIVAGSIVLPAPHIASGRLTLTSGSLQNVSVVFGPDGALHPHVIAKAFPTARELPFTVPARAENIRSFETPAGRLGVLICADSWYPQAYLPLKQQQIDLLAVPSYDVFGMEQWNRPWAGYSGWPAPEDVDLNDVASLTEGQAWKKYALAGRIRSIGVTKGLNVFLRGKIWDQDLGGWPATVVRDDEVFIEEQTQRPPC